MNIAKHMEAIFVVAVIVACSLAYSTTQAPVITVNVSARNVPHSAPITASIAARTAAPSLPAKRIG